MKLVRIHGQPSWAFASNRVEAAITRQGGHLGPVRFRLPHGVIQPYAVAPWAEEELPAGTIPLVESLRGDFFCAPFGSSEKTYRGEKHPVHGETANADWTFESLEKGKAGTTLHLSLKTRVRAGRVDKIVALRPGETAVYSKHVISGMAGPLNFGHHATLKFPDAPGSGLINTSRMSFGQVLPVPFELPENKGYTCLKTGAPFSRLDRVPAANGGFADLTAYPARLGFEDLVMFEHKAASDFAWIAVTFPAQRYAWFALKDPRVLRCTLMWISNGGRHYAPWSGRHTGVMGLEDVTSYFHLGLPGSVAANSFSRRGIATTLTLSSKKPLVVNYIMGVAEIPKGWGRVKTIKRGKGGITLQSARGRAVSVPLDADFLHSQP